MLLRLSSKRGPAAATGVRAVLAGRRRSFLPGMPGAASSSTDRSRTFRSQKLIPFSTETIFNVVAAVDKYDHFLPWCLSSRVLSRRGAEESSNEELQTEIAVGFQMLQARFRSVVEIEPHRRIHAVSEPNKHLEHLSFTWDFEPFSETSCRLDLRLEFGLKKSEHMIMWDFAQDKVVAEYLACFQRRCAELQAELPDETRS